MLNDEKLARISDVLCRYDEGYAGTAESGATYMQIGWGGFANWTRNNAKRCSRSNIDLEKKS